MTITVYTNSSDKRVVAKTITQVSTSTTAKLLDECSVLNPQIVIDYAAALLTANYVYIPTFSRYYFIDNITVLDGKRIQLDLSVDVLMSYATPIKALTCVVKRNTNLYNLYLDDPYFQAYNKKQIQTKIISSSVFNPSQFTSGTPCFVLTVAEGGLA